MKLFLGVDGGQSSTVALIADETGRVLGAGRGGPCNHAAAGEGRARFTSAMRDCLESACLQANLDPATIEFEAAALGFSGGAEDKEEYSRQFFRSQHFFFSNDAEIALLGATAGEPGIILIAGTGSIALGKNRAGKLARAGGWGYIFGDEGGAFDIVRQALRSALAMEEGWGTGTALRDMLLAHTGATSANSLMHRWYNHFDRKAIAQLAAAVTQTANAGDSCASQLLERAGKTLAEYALHVYKGLHFLPGEPVTVSYIGGVFESVLLTNACRQTIQASGLTWRAPLYPPAAGALLKALHESGCRVQLTSVPEIKI